MNDLVNIENKILIIRGQQVMLDRDLAGLYGVETKVLNQAVKRNIERFPERFMFQLTNDEQTELVTNCDRFRILKHSVSNSYVFTEQGVAMLASVLKNSTAIQISIKIIDAFIVMRRFLLNNAKVFTEIDSIKHHLIESDIQHRIHEQKIETLFSLMDKYKIEDKQGIFVQGQIFDAHSAFQSLIRKAKKEITLIDNYIDLTVLNRFTKKNPNVKVTIYTMPNTNVTKLDETKFNAQYPTLSIRFTSTMHDRFLIIDNAEIYHIGASIKDLGKKCFGFTKLEDARWIKTVLQAL